MLLNKNETSNWLRISKAYLNLLIQGKQIPFIKLGKRVLFSEDDLIKWINSKKEKEGN